MVSVMADNVLHFHYDVDGSDFTTAGESSSALKRTLRQIGVSPEVIRKIAIAMYEGEINMVIHANGGTIDVDVSPEQVYVKLSDTGPGIPDVEKAMTEGYSTASDRVRELGFGAGMGLPNMKKYTDSMMITTQIGKGTIIEMTVKCI